MFLIYSDIEFLHTAETYELKRISGIFLFLLKSFFTKLLEDTFFA
jgi:hypothetical protein